MAEKKYYRRLFTIEVISVEPVDFDTLTDLYDAVRTDEWNGLGGGLLSSGPVEKISEARAEDRLADHGIALHELFPYVEDR